MKRYIVSIMRTTGTKSGVGFVYSGRTDNPQDEIAYFESHTMKVWSRIYNKHEIIEAMYIGLRIVDSQTKEIVYQSQRVNNIEELRTYL